MNNIIAILGLLLPFFAKIQLFKRSVNYISLTVFFSSPATFVSRLSTNLHHIWREYVFFY
jgi:hypothetical protein